MNKFLTFLQQQNSTTASYFNDLEARFKFLWVLKIHYYPTWLMFC